MLTIAPPPWRPPKNSASESVIEAYASFDDFFAGVTFDDDSFTDDQFGAENTTNATDNKPSAAVPVAMMINIAWHPSAVKLLPMQFPRRV